MDDRTNQCIIVQQPQSVVSAGPLQDPPDDYMGYSIFVALCCCWCVGVSAILSSTRCRSAIAAGDRVTADFKSREARRRANIAFGIGLVFTVAEVIFGILLISNYHQ
jgi:hypothetical protein